MIGVTWKGNDTGLGNVIAADEATSSPAKKIGNLEVRSCAEKFLGWTLQMDRRFEPQKQDWKVILNIADYLPSTPLAS